MQSLLTLAQFAEFNISEQCSDNTNFSEHQSLLEIYFIEYFSESESEFQMDFFVRFVWKFLVNCENLLTSNNIAVLKVTV